MNPHRWQILGRVLFVVMMTTGLVSSRAASPLAEWLFPVFVVSVIGCFIAFRAAGRIDAESYAAENGPERKRR